MKTIRFLSLIARLALMITMVLGLVFWIAQIPALSALLTLLAQISFPSIHEGFGLIGVLFLLVLSAVAVRARGVRMLALSGVIYAFIVPTFGLTQALILVGDLHWLIQIAHLLLGIGAMYLALEIEKRYQRLVLGSHCAPLSDTTVLPVKR